MGSFKSCLRALGYDLPMVEDGEPEPEFEAILDVVDPNRDGFVTLQEYMAFMISKETENVQSSEEIELAFRAITNQERDYVTKEELYSNLSKEMAEYYREDATLHRSTHWPTSHRCFGLRGVHSYSVLLNLLEEASIVQIVLFRLPSWIRVRFCYLIRQLNHVQLGLNAM